MSDGRGKWLEKVDGVLWAVGVVAVVVALVIGGAHSWRSLLARLRSSWVYSSGLLFVVAGVAVLAIVLRWWFSREEADLRRKYPPRAP
jgi:hypothetical protein